MKKNLLLLFFCFLNIQTHAQKFLTLTKPGFNHRLHYQAGDVVGFKLKSDNHRYKGGIAYVTDSMVAINDSGTVLLSDVKIFYDYEQGAGARFGSRLLLSGGLLYGLIILVNGTVGHTRDLHNNTNGIITGSLIGGGLLLLPFTKRRYKINHNRWLKVIDVTIIPASN